MLNGPTLQRLGAMKLDGMAQALQEQLELSPIAAAEYSVRGKSGKSVYTLWEDFPSRLREYLISWKRRVPRRELPNHSL